MLQEVARLTHLNQTMQTQINNLSAEVQDQEDLNKQNKAISEKVALLESLLGNKQTENENLKEQEQELQKKEQIAADEIQSLIAKVARLESLRQEETERLSAAVLDLQHQVRDSQQLIRDKDEEIQKLTYAGEELRQTLQQEASQEEEILAGVERPRDENFSETTPEDQGDRTMLLNNTVCWLNIVNIKHRNNASLDIVNKIK